MEDLGFMGFATLETAFPLAIQCRNSSRVATAPSGAPTFRVYKISTDAAIETGTLGSSDTDSQTGWRTGSVTPQAANGYTSGGTYAVLFGYTTDAAYTPVGYFQVL